MSPCSFCNTEEKKITREHIWSQALLRLFDDIAPFTINEAIGKWYPADPVIKDLCTDCNGSLSSADAAFTEFATATLRSTIDFGSDINLDPVLLSRWAVKTASNHERATRSGNKWWLNAVSFMRGEASQPVNIDVLFGAWGHDIDEELVNGVFDMDKRPLLARPIIIMELLCGSTPVFLEELHKAWALRIGSAVILVLSWKDPNSYRREAAIREMRGFHWLLVGYDKRVEGCPFVPPSHVFFDWIISPLKPLDMWEIPTPKTKDQYLETWNKMETLWPMDAVDDSIITDKN